MGDMTNLLCSRLPGRIRVRHPALRARAGHSTLAEQLARWDGMISVEGNLSTGSLLLHYDVARCVPADMEARVAEAAAAIIGITATPAATPAPTPRLAPTPQLAAISRRITSRSTLRQLNRGAKIGMMASLPLSLAALAFSKRTHTAAGVVFVALTLVHMTANRRYLLT